MRKFTSLLMLCLFSIFLLASCSNQKVRTGYCVTFHLEGATYQQSEEIRYYYPTNTEGTIIFEPNDLIVSQTDKITKPGYYLEGWYLSPDFEPTEKWDFAKDKLTAEGLDLYANWKLETVYKFAIYPVIDGEPLGDGTMLGEYTVSAGDTFSDYRHYAENVEGYTFVEFKDEDGNIINEDEYAHPGGDVDTTINIYANYIEGEYTIVRSYDDLEDAIADKTNIYLYNDIDCDGEDLDFGDFIDREFIGNGHTISNFSYNDLLSSGLVDGIKYISLFGTVENSNISDVSFIAGAISYGNYTRVTAIHIYPCALHINNSTLANISITYSINVYGNDAKEKTSEHSDYSIDSSDATVTNVSINKIN